MTKQWRVDYRRRLSAAQGRPRHCACAANGRLPPFMRVFDTLRLGGPNVRTGLGPVGCGSSNRGMRYRPEWAHWLPADDFSGSMMGCHLHLTAGVSDLLVKRLRPLLALANDCTR